jgi:hypothetical protein
MAYLLFRIILDVETTLALDLLRVRKKCAGEYVVIKTIGISAGVLALAGLGEAVQDLIRAGLDSPKNRFRPVLSSLYFQGKHG